MKSSIDKRKYQEDDGRALLRLLRAHRRVLYVLPTGGGKTVVACMLILQWLRASKRVVVFVHRAELLEQMWRTLTGRMGLRETDVGIIRQNDKRTNPDAMIQVCSIDTTLRREMWPKADFVIADEAHRGVARKWQQAFSWYPEARILGLTATPIRLDGKPLKDAFDVMHEGPTLVQLIELGYLLKPRIYVRDGGRSIDMTNVRVNRGDYDREESERRASRSGVLKAVWDHISQHGGARNGIIFACGLKHAEKILQEGLRRGRYVKLVTGDTPEKERRAILEPGGWLDKGSRRYVVSVDVLIEGYDLPSLKLVVPCRPTLSEAVYRHSVGRILRKPEMSAKSGRGWSEPMVLDLTMNTVRFGRPQDPRTWSLDGAPVEGGDGGKMVQRVKVCEACDAANEPGAKLCEECGAEFPTVRIPSEVSGKLVEVTETMAKAFWEKRRREIEKRALKVGLKPGDAKVLAERSVSSWAH